MQLRILTDEDVKAALSMEEAIEISATAFKKLSAQESVVPLRTIMSTPHGFSGFMPAFCPGKTPEDSALGLKIVAVRPNNPANHGLATIPAQVFLVNPETGLPLALMDGTYLTLLRTAAGSGVATKLLAKPNAKKLVVFGAGNQALSHIEAVLVARPSIKKIVLVNRTAENAINLVNALHNIPKYKGISISQTNNPRMALVGADIVCTTTGSSTPLFDGRDLEPGCHINCIGAHHPTTREVDETTIKRACIVVDERKACFAEAGDILLPIKDGAITKDQVVAELGEVVAGKTVRNSEEDITLFKSVGIAIQDVSVGLAVYKNAVERNLGIVVGGPKL